MCEGGLATAAHLPSYVALNLLLGELKHAHGLTSMEGKKRGQESQKQ